MTSEKAVSLGCATVGESVWGSGVWDVVRSFGGSVGGSVDRAVGRSDDRLVGRSVGVSVSRLDRRTVDGGGLNGLSVIR